VEKAREHSALSERRRAAERGRRRQRQFLTHLAAYFATVMAVVLVNRTMGSAEPWFLLPMIGWGGVLAIHAAHVMGLFDIFMKPPKGES
jgi:hypothetical protein